MNFGTNDAMKTGKWPLLAIRALLIPILLLACFPAAAQPELVMPVRCDPGKDCWVVNYVDHDPGEGIRDYTCGKATYNVTSKRGNRHQGVDIAIRDLAVMAGGVEVLAAAPGIVRGVRDGMKDVSVREIGHAALKGKDCGNRVGIEHADGWLTQYCHLRRGSVAVRNGDRVEAGQAIGLIGLSGFTEYPHLHVQVMKGRDIVDPFTGTGRTDKCSVGDKPLWTKEALARLPYRPTALYTAGFSATRPDPKQARAGRLSADVLAPASKALVLWVDIFHVHKGDKLEFRIVTPGGKALLKHRVVIKKRSTRHFAYAGKPLKASQWPAGVYAGEIRLIRDAGSSNPQKFAITRRVMLQ